MILNEFPDITWLKKQIASNFNDQRSWDNVRLPNKGWPSVVLNVKTKTSERLDIRGPFSIFMNVKGWSTVGADKKNIRINEHAYILTNHGQYYNLLINEPEATETLNIHFGEQFYKDALYALGNKDEHLLDNPLTTSEPWNVPMKTVFRDSQFNYLVNEVISNSSTNGLLKEEPLYRLFHQVFCQYQEDNQNLQGFDRLKKSTRQEILKRLLLARDYIHVFYPQPISLQELAEVSCLSRFHFLRLFKEVFCISPYQYIKRIRLQRALDLIKKNKYTLDDIALKVGLNNGSSLSRMVYQSKGKYPSMLFNS